MISASDNQNEINANITNETKSLTFKDWKLLKYGNNNNEKTENNIKLNASSNIRNRFHNNFNGPRNPFISGLSNTFSAISGPADYLPSNSLNNFNTRGNCFNDFNPYFNCLNRANNVDFNLCNNFENSKEIYNFPNTDELQNSYRRNRYNNNWFKGEGNNNFGRSDNFFTSDCVYTQRDMMQKPISIPNRKFDKPQYSKYGKQKQNCERRNLSSPHNVDQKSSDDTKKRPKEPEVYIKNSRANGKPYIPKPKIPEANSELTKEEKKEQWKEYRQAMKPFKNRDFYNAKRVVQRLGKLTPSELDEKQLLRLKKAEEYIDTYKTRLNIKYPNFYVKANDSNKLGELYVLEKSTKESV